MAQPSDNRAAYAHIKRNRRITTLIVIAIFVFGTIYALTRQTGSVTAQVDQVHLGVLGSYGDPLFIKLEDIDEFRLIESVDFGDCVDGEQTKNTMSGRYTNEEFGEYELHVYTEKAPYIVVEYRDGEILLFNLGSKRNTNTIYDDLQEALG